MYYDYPKFKLIKTIVLQYNKTLHLMKIPYKWIKLVITLFSRQGAQNFILIHHENAGCTERGTEEVIPLHMLQKTESLRGLAC